MTHPYYTVRAKLRTETANDKGLCQIAIVHTSKGKRTFYSTGLRVLPKQWDGERVKNHQNASLYNDQIEKSIIEVEAKHLSAGKADNSSSFLEYAQKTLSTLDIAEDTTRQWKIIIEQIRQYSPLISFSAMTPEWLYRYLKHRLQTVQSNTARKSFVFIRRMFNEAKKEGVTTLYPFKDFKLPAAKEGKQLYLTIEELDKLEALFSRTSLRPVTRSTLAHFLLECYSGIRHSDWRKWHIETLTDSESLKLTTTKTDAPIYIPIDNSPRLKAIIDRIRGEGLAYSYTNQDANRQLKFIAMLAEINKALTTHVGRHTSAVLLLEKGFSKETIADVLGISLRVVNTYAKMTRQKVKTEFARLGGL